MWKVVRGERMTFILRFLLFLFKQRWQPVHQLTKTGIARQAPLLFCLTLDRRTVVTTRKAQVAMRLLEHLCEWVCLQHQIERAGRQLFLNNHTIPAGLRSLPYYLFGPMANPKHIRKIGERLTEFVYQLYFSFVLEHFTVNAPLKGARCGGCHIVRVPC